MNEFSIWAGFGLPVTVALAAVAVIGYVFGRRSRRPTSPDKSPTELLHAAEIARQLETVASSLRSDLASHQSEVGRFKEALRRAAETPDPDRGDQLREEADRILEPTLRLVGRVAKAYDQIRRQSRALSDYSGGRTDPLTGICNQRALNELLQVELASHAAVSGELAVAIFGLPEESDKTRGEREVELLLAVELLRPQLRDADLIARYGINELVVVMPHTRLYGASSFARRARAVLRESGLPAAGGVAQSMHGDEPSALLGRADSALYSAKAAGGAAQYLHNGRSIRLDTPREEDHNGSTDQGEDNAPQPSPVAASEASQSAIEPESYLTK